MYPRFPRPIVVDAKELLIEDKYISPKPFTVEVSCVLEMYPALPNPVVVEVNDSLKITSNACALKRSVLLEK